MSVGRRLVTVMVVVREAVVFPVGGSVESVKVVISEVWLVSVPSKI